MNIINRFHGFLTSRINRKIDELSYKLEVGHRYGFYKTGGHMADDSRLGQVKYEIEQLQEKNRNAYTRKEIRKLSVDLQCYLIRHYRFFDQLDTHLNVYRLFDYVLLGR